MFKDKRSKRVLLTAHCILNQNAKIDRCAHYPGMIKEVAAILIETGVGIVQMPCPELVYLGLDRQADRRVLTTIESEDTRVRRRMIEDRGKALCRKIAQDLVYQIEEYQQNGFEVVGIVGINGSPSCGVETTWSNDQEERGSGVFIQMLAEECHRRNIRLLMRGIKAYEPQRAVAAVMELCKIGNHS
jgi:predicted secreted protein